jgi:hypothetical protein
MILFLALLACRPDDEPADSDPIDTDVAVDTDSDEPADTDTDPGDSDTGGGCEEGEILDGEDCVAERCGVGTYGNIPIEDGTLFVNPASTASSGNGSEEYPFKDLETAIEWAGERGGAHLAVAAGEYHEALLFNSEAANVRLQGRCPELVRIDGSSDASGTLVTMFLREGDTASISDVTITGSAVGLYVARGIVVGRGLVLEGNTLSVLASGATSEVRLSGSVVRDSGPSEGYYARAMFADEGARLVLDDVVVTDIAEDGIYLIGASLDATNLDLGRVGLDPIEQASIYGILAAEGADVVLRGGRLHDSVATGVLVYGATAALEDVTIEGHGPPDGVIAPFGFGAQVMAGGSLTLTGGVIDGNVMHDLRVLDGAAIVSGTVFSGATRSRGFAMAVGVLVDEGGDLQGDGARFEGNDGVGLVVADGTASCTGCAAEGNSFAGLVAAGGATAWTGGTIADNAPDASEGGGVGLFAANGAELVVTGAEIGEHELAGAWFDGDGAWTLEDVTIAGGPGVELRPGLRLHGNAVYATGTASWDGERGLRIAGGALTDATQAIFLDAGSATVDGVVFSGNDVDVWQQRCDGVAAVDVIGSASVTSCPDYDLLVMPLDYSDWMSDIGVD